MASPRPSHDLEEPGATNEGSAATSDSPRERKDGEVHRERGRTSRPREGRGCGRGRNSPPLPSPSSPVRGRAGGGVPARASRRVSAKDLGRARFQQEPGLGGRGEAESLPRPRDNARKRPTGSRVRCDNQTVRGDGATAMTRRKGSVCTESKATGAVRRGELRAELHSFCPANLTGPLWEEQLAKDNKCSGRTSEAGMI